MRSAVREKQLPDYRIIRSKRKTISLQIDRNLQVTVRCPLNTSAGQVDSFVQAHGNWILKHLESMEQEQQCKAHFSYDQGQTLYLLGEPCRIEIGPPGDQTVTVSEERLVFGGGIDDRKAAAREFYRLFARRYLPGRVEHFARLMHVNPLSVKITSANTRWGSCSAKGAICFSWRLVCLPPELVDSVVVHELAHLREHNHSPRFYQVVESVLPDYPTLREKIRRWQKRLPV